MRGRAGTGGEQEDYRRGRRRDQAGEQEPEQKMDKAEEPKQMQE